MSRVVNAKNSKVLKRLKQIGKGTSSYTAFAGVLDGETYPDGVPVAQVAFDNEYGKGVPPRPAMRMAAAAKKRIWLRLFKVLVMKGMAPEKALEMVGEAMMGAIKEKIATFTIPPNAPATIKAKGFDAPLRDSKTYFHGIDYEVVKKGKVKNRTTIE